jgi:hypothetical protein
MGATQTTAATRAEQLDEYVLRVSLSDLTAMLEFTHAEMFGEREIDIITSSSTGEDELERELFLDHRDDGPEKDPDYQAATTRAMALSAAIFSQLATDEVQEYLRAEATRFAKLVADRLAVAAERLTSEEA